MCTINNIQNKLQHERQFHEAQSNIIFESIPDQQEKLELMDAFKFETWT